MGLNSIGTIILEVCEMLECAADQCIKFGGSKEVKMGLNSIGTGILEFCEWSECAADQCFG